LHAKSKTKYTWILASTAFVCAVLGVVGVMVGQGLLLKVVLAVAAFAAAASCATFALAIHRTTPSD
jgi:archaellum biogenesis protein FlaJ (TadC family)